MSTRETRTEHTGLKDCETKAPACDGGVQEGGPSPCLLQLPPTAIGVNVNFERSCHLRVSSPAKLSERLKYEDEVLRALAQPQYLHCKLGVIFPVDDDDQRQLVLVPVLEGQSGYLCTIGPWQLSSTTLKG